MEILLRPAILILLTLVGMVLAARGISRNVAAEDDKTGLKTYNYSFNARAGLTGGLTVLAGVLLFFTLVVVPTGHRGVTFSQWAGIDHNERGEGISLQVPFLQNTVNISVQEQLYEIELPQQTKDLQEVGVPVGVNYAIDPERASEMYQDVGNVAAFEAKIIKPALEQIVKAEVGQINAIDFAQERNQLAIDIGISVSPRLSEHGVELTFLAVEDAVFQAEFITAVQLKVIAAEEAARQQNLEAAATATANQAINIAEGTKQSIILAAQGEREAIEEIASALGFTTDEYLEWVLLNQWSGILPETVVGAGDFGVLLEVGSN